MAQIDGRLGIETKLEALGRRVRRLRVVHGSARIAVLLTTTAFIAILADAQFALPAWARSGLLAAWLIMATIAVRRWLIRPLTEPLDAVMLAGVVESEFPRLDERLTTAAELLNHREPANGAPGLIAEVINETEIRTGWVDFRAAAPARATVWFAVISCLVITAIVSPLAVVHGSSEQVRRFFMPWHSPAAEAPFRIVVSSGNAGVARGDSITLAGYVVPLRPAAALPANATLHVRDGRGSLERLPMRAEQQNVFFLRRGNVAADFEYRIEAGAVASEWFRVTAVDPVWLTEGRIRIKPPAYATDGEQTLDGLAELTVLQHSRLTFNLRLDRAPVAAWLDWSPGAMDDARTAARRYPLEIGAENRAVLSVPATTSGSFRLVLEAELGVQNEYPAQPLQVRIDQAPRFLNVQGVAEQPRFVKPGEPLKVACVVADDMAVSRVELEYRVGGGPIARVSIPVKGAGTPRAGGELIFDLAGKISEHDAFEYRLAASDNRVVPDAGLGPNISYFPVQGRWATLRTGTQAEPLAVQEVAGRKQEIDQRLLELVKDLKEQKQNLVKFKVATARQPALRIDQSERLVEMRGAVRETTKRLAELARDVALTDGLAALAAGLQSVADQELAAVESGLRLSEREPALDPRTKHLESSDAAFAQAITKLEVLRTINEKLAADRLDRQRLAQLSEEQQALADAAAKADADAAKKLVPPQGLLEERLRKLLEQSDRLRGAVDDLNAKEAERLSALLRELARQQRELTEAMNSSEQVARKNRFAELLRRQQEIADAADRLARRTEAPARAAQVPPLQPEQAQLAREALENDRPHDAVQMQEKAALELDRLAGHLEGAAALARDPREAARQLTRLQDDLQQRLTQEAKDITFDQLPAKRRHAFAAEQEAIRAAAEQIAIPVDSPAALARREAVEKASQAVEQLNRNAPMNPDAAMSATRDALARMADRMPALDKRLARAKQEVIALRGLHETLARQVEQAARALEKQDPDTAATRAEFAKKIADVIVKETELLQKLHRLDAPTLEIRQQRTIQAFDSAIADLKEGLIHDAPASQQQVRRELERLEQALGGQKPADERVEELARRQRGIAALAEKAIADPAKANDLLIRQSDAIRELQMVSPNEAPIHASDAMEKLRRAEAAIQSGANPAETARLAREGAEALDQLAGQLAGRETEAEHAERLARRQKAAASEAEARVKKPVNPADLVEVRKRLQQSFDELRQIRGGPGGQRDKQKAVEALQQAQQSAPPDRMAKALRAAAEALQQLTDKLAKLEASRPETLKQAPRVAAGRNPLPSVDESAEARRLAREQRTIRDEVLGAIEELARPNTLVPDNPLGALQKAQEELARKSADLAKNVAKHLGGESGAAKQGARGAEAASDAAKELQLGLVGPALNSGEKAAEQLKELARAPIGGESKAAGELAREQSELNRKLAALQGSAETSRTQQLSRQEQLRMEAMQATQDLERIANEMNRGAPGAGDAASQAADSARAAGESMKEASATGKKGQREAMAQSQERAARSLEQAASRAGDAGKRTPREPDGPMPDLGAALELALQAMRQSRVELNQGKPTAAEPRMRDAARALNDAANRSTQSAMGKAGKLPSGNGVPGANEGASSGVPDLSHFGPEAAKHAGKAWGDLPGELKTRLIQDWKTRYGEDYARNIRYYFEQLAERK